MSENAEGYKPFSPELLRRRIAARLDLLGLTPITAATKAGLPRDTIRNLFRPTASGLPRIDTMAKIADALETSVAYLIGEADFPNASQQAAEAENARPPVAAIPVVASTGEDPTVPENENDYFFLEIPGFEDVSLFAVRVGDDSADLHYQPPRYVVCAPQKAVGVRNGDHVVLLTRPQGRDHWRVMELVTGGSSLFDGLPGLASLASDTKKWPHVPTTERRDDAYVAGVVVGEVAIFIRPPGETMFAAFEPPTLWKPRKTTKKATPPPDQG